MGPTTRRIAIEVAVVVAVVVFTGGVALLVADKDLVLGNLTLRWQAGSAAKLPFTADEVRREAARPPAAWAEVEGPPRNVIIVIGDGMGIGSVSTTSALIHGPAGGLAMEAAPAVGLMKTWSANDLVTDSAASATAMATGFKTNNRMLAMLPDGRRVRTLLEAARDAGMATGVVTTSGLVDATPAGFTTHAVHRKRYGEILEGMIASGVDVMLGGDWGHAGKDWREHDPVALAERARSAGYTVVTTRADLEAVGSAPVMGLFPRRSTGSGGDYGPPLVVCARRALELLGAGDRAFVVMIESEVTDEIAHDNDIAGLLEGMNELDETVREVLEVARSRGDTLVLVTADHDTGGLAVDDGDYDEGLARIRWATGDHTAQWVPLFAFGPGSERFGTLLDNTDIARLLGELLDLPDFPRIDS